MSYDNSMILVCYHPQCDGQRLTIAKKYQESWYGCDLEESLAEWIEFHSHSDQLLLGQHFSLEFDDEDAGLCLGPWLERIKNADPSMTLGDFIASNGDPWAKERRHCGGMLKCPHCCRALITDGGLTAPKHACRCSRLTDQDVTDLLRTIDRYPQ